MHFSSVSIALLAWCSTCYLIHTSHDWPVDLCHMIDIISGDLCSDLDSNDEVIRNNAVLALVRWLPWRLIILALNCTCMWYFFNWFLADCIWAEGEKVCAAAIGLHDVGPKPVRACPGTHYKVVVLLFLPVCGCGLKNPTCLYMGNGWRSTNSWVMVLVRLFYEVIHRSCLYLHAQLLFPRSEWVPNPPPLVAILFYESLL